MPALDGLRAAAVLAVLLYHGGVPWMQGGFLGVDAFFVLSGFLITGLLLNEGRCSGTINIGAFWLRRARRLLPALLLVILAVAMYAAWLAPADQLGSLRADALATLGYAANWRFVASGQSYFDQFVAPSPLRHTWSLAIEEQFYLVWPLVVLVWLRVRGGSARGFGVLCAGLACASAVAMALLYTPGDDVSRVYYGTDTRAQALLIGAALAVVVHRRGIPTSLRAQRAIRTLALVGAALTLVLWTSVSDASGWMYLGGYALAAIAIAAVLASISQPHPGMVGRALSIPPLRWVGLVSYGLYLWHWPVFVVCVPTRMGVDGTGLLAIRLAITFALATASYYVIEQPIRRGALRRRHPWVVAPAAALAVVAIVIVATLAPGPAVAPSSSSIASRSTATTAPTPPSSTASAATKVLVVGDSIALSLAEGMKVDSASSGIVVRNEGFLGCGIISGGQIWTKGRPVEISPKCAQWPDRWGRAVGEFDPDVAVILVGAWDAYDRQINGSWVTFGTPASDALLRADLESGIDLLSSRGAHVVLLTTPYYEYRYTLSTPDVSRSAFVLERVDHLNALYARIAASDPRVTLVDLNHRLSPDGKIHETIDGMAVQGDGVHFSPEGAMYVSRWLEPKIERLVATRPALAAAP